MATPTKRKSQPKKTSKIANKRKTVEKLRLSSQINRYIAFLVVALVGAIGYTIVTSYAFVSGPRLYVSPATTSVTAGQTFDVVVRVDSAGESVNAVQANITYPTSNFEFVALDATNSAFTIEAEAITEPGVVKIARGNISGISGDVLVAKLTLRATSTTGGGKKSPGAVISFANGSSLVRAADNVNVLSTLESSSVKITSTKTSGGGNGRGPNR